MEVHHRICLHQNGASQSYHREIILLVDLGEFARVSWVPAVPRQRGAKCRGKKRVFISTVNTVYFGILRRDLWSQGTKCVVCKKKKNLTWSPQKRSRPALTYHKLLSNFIFLTSSKYKLSAETFVDVSKHFQKNIIANFSEWVQSAQKPVFSSAVNFMFYNFPALLSYKIQSKRDLVTW